MWSWDSVYRITEVSSVNYCDQFLQLGDKILKVNHTPNFISLSLSLSLSLCVRACVRACVRLYDMCGVCTVYFVAILCWSGLGLGIKANSQLHPTPGEQHFSVPDQAFCHEEAAQTDQQAGSA